MRVTRKHGWLKSLDRYAGIPLVAATAPLRMGRRFDHGAIRRIGLMKTAAIGDAVLMSAPAADVRRTFPDAQLAIITGEDNAGVVPLLPFHVDSHVIVSPARPIASTLAVRRAALDVIVDFGSWPRFDAMLAALSGARWRIGFQRAGQFRGAAFDETVAHSSELHELDNYRRLVALLGVESVAQPRLIVASGQPGDANVDGPYIVFHPWSGGDRHEVKEWHDDRWVELATRLGKEFSFIVTGGPGDVARSERLVGALRAKGVVACASQGELGQTAALLQGAAAVVSVNTGIMHVAAAVGAPTISLEGPVPVSRWGPIGARVSSVTTTYPQCGYLDLGFEYAGERADCMDGVSVDAVYRAVRELLAQAGHSTGMVDPSLRSG